MKILPLYKMIVGLQGCVYKIDSLYGGSLKLEDRDFPSYLSYLSKRLFLTLRSGFTLCLEWLGMKTPTLIYITPPPQ